VVFHWLRRERVFERDIFRFGTGTGPAPSGNTDLKLTRRNYRVSPLFCEIEPFETFPTSVNYFVGMIIR
jgi:hypothetical protein